MEAYDIKSDVKLINKIHTLEILRSEIKNYKYFADEKRKCLDEYSYSLKELNEKIEFYDHELLKVRSATIGDGLGGYSPTYIEKLNDCLIKKELAEKEKQKWISDNNEQFYSDIYWWQSRIDTMEYYLGLMNENDSYFIHDLYIEPLGFKEVMKKYRIENNGDVYRKASNILKKVIKYKK